MSDIKIDFAHQKLPDTKRSSVASKPSMERCAENLARGTPASWRLSCLEECEQKAADRKFADIGSGDPDRKRRVLRRPQSSIPQGVNRQAITET